MLCEVSRELEKLGPMYLAMMLAQETYARETLEQCAFGNGNIEVAVQATVARLRRMLASPRYPGSLIDVTRQERHARRMKGILELSERMKLVAAGEPLPDTRRRSRKAA